MLFEIYISKDCSHSAHKKLYNLIIKADVFVQVGPVGIEPTTHGLKVRCSTDWAKGPNAPSLQRTEFSILLEFPAQILPSICQTNNYAWASAIIFPNLIGNSIFGKIREMPLGRPINDVPNLMKYFKWYQFEVRFTSMRFQPPAVNKLARVFGL